MKMQTEGDTNKRLDITTNTYYHPGIDLWKAKLTNMEVFKLCM